MSAAQSHSLSSQVTSTSHPKLQSHLPKSLDMLLGTHSLICLDRKPLSAGLLSVLDFKEALHTHLLYPLSSKVTTYPVLL